MVANPQIRAGTLKPLGVSTESESRHVPGVKSFAQQGFAGLRGADLVGLPRPRRHAGAGPAADGRGAVGGPERPEVRNKLEEQGADVVAGGPERTRRFLNAEIQKWGQVIRDNNITLES